jgi:hypothetical protein
VEKMNRDYKKYPNYQLPLKIDSFVEAESYYNGKGEHIITKYFAEYDGFHFEGKTIKSVVNQILKYIFRGGEE